MMSSTRRSGISTSLIQVGIRLGRKREPARGRLSSSVPRGTLLSAPSGVFEMGPDEPLEQLQFAEVPDYEILRHRILLGELLLGLAVVFDDSRVHAVEGGEVLRHRRLPERVI